MKHLVSALIIAVLILSYGAVQSLQIPLFQDVQALETIYVTADKKAGRYDGPIYVKITASDPDAKIWYTCKRNGTPSDLLKYEKPILLKKSCALIYFAYVDTQLESKIERTDYTILYSDDVKLETEDQVLSLRNTGTGTVDVGNWEIIAGTGSITIQPGTTILPGESYSIGKVDPASYELKSPEWYTKNQIAVAPPPKPIIPAVKLSVPSPELAISSSKSTTPPPETQTPSEPKEISASHEPKATDVSDLPPLSPAPTANIPSSVQWPDDSTSTQPPNTSLTAEDYEATPEQRLKASAGESESGNSTTPIALGILGLTAAAAMTASRFRTEKSHSKK